MGRGALKCAAAADAFRHSPIGGCADAFGRLATEYEVTGGGRVKVSEEAAR
jgi:hypothetical protein